jgi:hypothetical protein
MMTARAAVAERRIAEWADAVGLTAEPMRRMAAEFARSESVLAMIQDAFANAYELNYLGWKVVRWPTPRLVVGDNAATALYPEQVFGVGDVWTEGARVMLPVSPTTALFLMRDLPPGACLVEERSEDGGDEQGALNFVSWSRARSEVYAGSREDLKRIAEKLSPSDRARAYPMQLPVRESVLLEISGVRGQRPRIQRPLSLGPEDARRRFEERFGKFDDGGETG